ncbi:Acyltransferase 3 [Apiospora arundinis]
MTVYLAVGAAGAWYAAFFAGMLMAELDALDADAATSLTTTTIDRKLMSYNNNHHARPRLPWDGLLDSLRQRPRFRSVLLHCMLAAGLYLGSAPSSDIMKVDELLGNCPGGWKTLSRLIPAPYTASDEPESVHRWFWLFWAAWLLFVSIKELDWVRSLFETRFSQYLGKHSFALYLVHGPLIGLYAERLFYLTGVKRGPPLGRRSRQIRPPHEPLARQPALVAPAAPRHPERHRRAAALLLRPRARVPALRGAERARVPVRGRDGDQDVRRAQRPGVAVGVPQAEGGLNGTRKG